MAIDYMEKSKADRGIFERISLYIPGYKGYREKNIRRDIDRLVRSHVGLQIKEVKTVMSDLKRQVLENGDMASVKSMERISTKIDTYMKSIESAESGYSGLWETIKTTESDLDSIVEWDEKLVVCSSELKDMLSEFRDKVDEGASDVKQDIRAIEKHVDDLRDGLNARKLVLKGLADQVEKDNYVETVPEEEPAEAEPEKAEEKEEEKEEEKPAKKKRGFFGFGRK